MKNIHIFLVSLILVSCEPFTEKFYTIELNNHSNSMIRYTYDKTNNRNMNYPDTLIYDNRDNIFLSPLSANSNTYIDSRKPWSEVINNLPNDTLSFYIFAEDTINSYPWEIISTEYKVLKRYDFSVQDLESLNYKISYPPTGQMKNVRMYPPYEGN